MKTEDLCDVFRAEWFPSLGVEADPERGAVLAARSVISSAVIDDEFLADCLLLELQRIREKRVGRGLVPFLTIPGVGVRLAFGYWPPGGTPGPHEHTAWTITAVCRNELEVVTFDREESYRRHELVRKNCFHAEAGRVGYIYEPCIHQPRNKSADWSLSFHASSPRDGQPLVDHNECLPELMRFERLPVDDPHPYASVILERQRQRFIYQLSRLATSLNVTNVPVLLDACFALASSPTRRSIGHLWQRSEQAHADSIRRLTRTHSDLILSKRPAGDLVAIDALTPAGPVEELVISEEASNMIDFIVREPTFDVLSLPGDLTEDERIELADLLEESGLFMRVQKNDI